MQISWTAARAGIRFLALAIVCVSAPLPFAGQTTAGIVPIYTPADVVAQPGTPSVTVGSPPTGAMTRQATFEIITVTVPVTFLGPLGHKNPSDGQAARPGPAHEHLARTEATILCCLYEAAGDHNIVGVELRLCKVGQGSVTFRFRVKPGHYKARAYNLLLGQADHFIGDSAHPYHKPPDVDVPPSPAGDQVPPNNRRLRRRALPNSNS